MSQPLPASGRPLKRPEMEIKNCEEYVLAELQVAQLKARYWHKKAKALAKELAAYKRGDRPVRTKK